MRKDQSGFTVIELLIVTVATTLITISLVAFMFNFWRYSYYSQANLNTLVERLNTGDYLRERLSASSGLITQNGIPDANPGLVDPIDGSGNYWSPVHAIPTAVLSGQDGNISPVIYFKGYSTATDKTLIMNGPIPYEDEYVVYLDADDSQVKVRTLVNPNTTATNRLKTTCPPETTTPACPEDVVLISDVESVERRYFSRSGNLIDWTSIYDSDIGEYIGPDNGAVEVVELTVKVAKKASFQNSNTIQNETIIRVAMRNT